MRVLAIPTFVVALLAAVALPLLPALPANASSAVGPVVQVSASPNPALVQVDNVSIDAHTSYDNACPISTYTLTSVTALRHLRRTRTRTTTSTRAVRSR